MIPILVKIGPVSIGSYGVMMATAFLTVWWLLKREFERNGYNPDWSYTLVFVTALAGIAGARIYFIFEHLPEFRLDPLGMIFSGSGLTWYGGFLAGFAAALLVLWKLPAPTLVLADLVAPLLLLGYAIGRIGCFLSGDGDYGPPTNLPWGMAFPHGLVPTTVRVHPTPLYETTLSLILFAILWKWRKKEHPPGLMLSGMLVFYGLERFVTEFWRRTPKILWGWMSMAQIISVFLIVAGGIWGYFLLRKWKTPKLAEAS